MAAKAAQWYEGFWIEGFPAPVSMVAFSRIFLKLVIDIMINWYIVMLIVSLFKTCKKGPGGTEALFKAATGAGKETMASVQAELNKSRLSLSFLKLCSSAGLGNICQEIRGAEMHHNTRGEWDNTVSVNPVQIII